MKDFLKNCGPVVRVEAIIVFWMTVMFGLSTLIAVVL